MPSPSLAAVARAIRYGALLVALVALNGLARHRHAQADLTRDRLHSIHPHTLEILGRFDDLVTITFYNTGNWGIERQGAVGEIRDLLGLIAGRGGENVYFHELDPMSAVARDRREAEALRLRKRGIQMTVDRLVVEGNQRETFGYMAIELEYLGRRRAINDPASAENLESRLAAALNMLLQEPRLVGVYADNPAARAKDFPGLMEALGEVGNVYDVSALGALPTEVEGLVVLAPATDLSEDLQRQIDAHIMAGKPTIFVVDGVWPYDGEIFTPNKSPIIAMLEHYGVRVPQRLLGEFAEQVAVREPIRTSQTTSSVLLNYFKFRTLPQNYDLENPIVRGLGPILFYCATPLMPADTAPEGVKVTPLIETSPLADVFGPTIKPYPDPRYTPDEAKLRSYSVATLLEGPFTSYFANGAEPAEAESESESGAEGEAPRRAPDDTKILVVSGSFSLRADGSGLRLLQNAVEQMGYNATLGDLRARRVAFEPLRPLEPSMRRRLSLFVILAPSIFLLTAALLSRGVSRVLRRRRAEEILAARSHDSGDAAPRAAAS